MVLAVGVLGARGGLPTDLADAENVMQVNFVGAGSLLMAYRRLVYVTKVAAPIVVLS